VKEAGLPVVASSTNCHHAGIASFLVNCPSYHAPPLNVSRNWEELGREAFDIYGSRERLVAASLAAHAAVGVMVTFRPVMGRAKRLPGYADVAPWRWPTAGLRIDDWQGWESERFRQPLQQTWSFCRMLSAERSGSRKPSRIVCGALCRDGSRFSVGNSRVVPCIDAMSGDTDGTLVFSSRTRSRREIMTRC